MTESELKELYLETTYGTFTPLYTYEDFIFNEKKQEHEYVDLVITKTAEEVYQEWLANKDKPPIVEPDKMEVLNEQVVALEKENKLLKSQVEVLSQTSDFHEELIVEMANKVYA